jgi:hypothetical protein
MADLVALPFEAIDAVSTSRNILSVKGDDTKEFVDPRNEEIGKRTWLRTAFDVVTMVLLPTMDFITDIVSVATVLASK